MPGIEFESDEQRSALVDWLSEKVGREEAGLIEKTKRNFQTHELCEIWVVGDEPLVIFKDAHKDTDNIIEALVSEKHAGELRQAGVIFDTKAEIIPIEESAIIRMGTNAQPAEVIRGE